MAATAGGAEAQAAASPFDRLFLNIKGLQGPEDKPEGEKAGGGPKDGGAAGESWGGWAEKARKAVLDKAEKARKAAYEALPQGGSSEASSEEQTSEAAERGEAGRGGNEPEPKWARWAKAAAGKVGKQVAEATKEARQNVAVAAERAKSHSQEWGEQFGESGKVLQGNITRGISRVSENAKEATRDFQEKGKKAQQLAKDIHGKSQQKLSEAKDKAAEKAKAAKDKAAQAAGSVKGAVVAGAGKVTGGLSGFAALAMSPAKLAQFGGVFLLGVFLISMSMSFLPVLPISPQKFALLFAFGSMTLLGSFAILKGPKSFLESLIQREKLPFSVAYFGSLVGTLAATIVMKSFILTAIFGVLQAVSLLYFLASYVPGGQALLNFCGRLSSRAARTVCRQATAG